LRIGVLAHRRLEIDAATASILAILAILDRDYARDEFQLKDVAEALSWRPIKTP
jgi:hypothetical protein